MDIKVQSVKVGVERTNCYVVSLKSGETAVIDPGAEAETILELFHGVKNLRLRYILLTHGHFDHVGAFDELKKIYPEVPVMISEKDVAIYHELPEQGVFVGRIIPNQHSELTAVGEGQYLPFGDYEIEVIPTPGHTHGGVCYRLEDNLFTGDTLFWHTVGRTDLPMSDNREMAESLDLLVHLDENLEIYPGHGKSSTIREEKSQNPYMHNTFPQ